MPSVSHTKPGDASKTTLFWAACLLAGLAVYGIVAFVGTTAAVQHDWGMVGFICLAASLPALVLFTVILNLLFPSIPLRQTLSLVLLTSMWAPVAAAVLFPVLITATVAVALSSVFVSPLLYIASPLAGTHRRVAVGQSKNETT